MGAVVALESLLSARTLWHAGRNAIIAADDEPTGHDALDALLSQRGRPRRALAAAQYAADIVTQRQRPGTAKGTIFVTLEDEYGMVNVVVWSHVALRWRKPLLSARLMAVRGRWEHVDGVQHHIANDLQDLSHLLGDLQTSSRDFH